MAGHIARTTAVMKRLLIALSLILPTLILVGAKLFPQLDGEMAHPLAHFYLVTGTAFAAVVMTFFTALTLQEESPPRHQIMAGAFAAMGVIFLIHGITTPGAITLTFNPGVQWGSSLTLFWGGLLFMVASGDRPAAPLTIGWVNGLRWVTVALCGLFIVVVFGRPSLLTNLDTLLGIWGRPSIFALSLAFWAIAAVGLGRTWQITHYVVDGVMVLTCLWLALATMSLHLFPLWHTSWWLYHLLLLLSVVVSMWALISQYESLREFQLTRYYAILSLVVTAVLALFTANFFSRTVQTEQENTLTTQAIRVGQNLAASVTSDLGTTADFGGTTTINDLRRLAQGNNFTLTNILKLRLTSLHVTHVDIYDNQSNLIYTYHDPIAKLPSQEIEAERLAQALDGHANATLLTTDDTTSTYLQAYTPILLADVPGNKPIGVIVASQEEAGFTEAVVQSRQIGLLIAGLSMGLLFLAMLAIVYRSDLVITTRTTELSQAYAQLQAAEGVRDDLTNMIVHDLRSPLTAINMNLHMLKQIGKKGAETTAVTPSAITPDRFIDNAQTSVERMITLINDILDVARLESGKVKIQQTAVHLAPLFQERAENYQIAAQADQKQLLLQLPPELPPVLGDEELLRRVLDNLISNALKYTPKGGQIQLGVDIQASEVTCWVADNGEGISPENAKHIFDKFVQVLGEDGKPLRRGAGLGLTFCRLVVEAHNGRIWAESKLSEGSTFYFTLPKA